VAERRESHIFGEEDVAFSLGLIAQVAKTKGGAT